MARTFLPMTVILCWIMVGSQCQAQDSNEGASLRKPDAGQSGQETLMTVTPGDVYRHTSKYHGDNGARDIEVETTKDGGLTMKALNDSSHIPATMALDPTGGGFGSPDYYPDALNSTNIHIVINKEVGYTDFAGLRFKQEAIVNIWNDGVVEVDKEDVTATQKSGDTWVSKR